MIVQWETCKLDWDKRQLHIVKRWHMKVPRIFGNTLIAIRTVRISSIRRTGVIDRTLLLMLHLLLHLHLLRHWNVKWYWRTKIENLYKKIIRYCLTYILHTNVTEFLTIMQLSVSSNTSQQWTITWTIFESQPEKLEFLEFRLISTTHLHTLLLVHLLLIHLLLCRLLSSLLFAQRYKRGCPRGQLQWHSIAGTSRHNTMIHSTLLNRKLLSSTHRLRWSHHGLSRKIGVHRLRTHAATTGHHSASTTATTTVGIQKTTIWFNKQIKTRYILL